MKTLIKIAWRSLWRNRRRTFLTAGAVIIAIVLALFTRSMQLGSYGQMIQAGVNQTGYLQVHDTGYQENQTIERSFFYSEDLINKIKNVPGISRVLKRTETFSLASFKDKTKGVLVSGIDPQEHDKQTKLSKKIIKGNYLSDQKHAVVIGDKMAEYLNISVGDSLVLIGQGYQGITSYGIYPVAGIFHLPSIEMNSQLVYMSLRDAQDFVYPYRPGILSTIAIYTNDDIELPTIQQKLSTALGKKYEVINWKVILSAMLQAITVDNMSGQVMLLILYVIAAFGIFSTVLMMTMEKRKQYAVMISIGMKRSKLITVSFLETVIITLVGIISGLVIIIPILYYLHLNPIPITGEMAKMYLEFNIDPILPFSIKPHLFIVQTLIIFCLSMLSALYPMIYLSYFNVLNAFRH